VGIGEIQTDMIMKKKICGLILICSFFLPRILWAQLPDSSSNKTFHIAIFAPLYLDSVFNNGILKYEAAIPKFIMPGVDFVQGARIALDTMNLNGRHVETFIYDSKSLSEPVDWLIRSGKLNNIDIIIGSVKNPVLTELAYFAKAKNIPFISATYPNSGGITNNPDLIIVNSTLKTHCEGIFSFILQNYGTDNIYLIKQLGDDRIGNYFTDINYAEGRPLLNIKTINVDSTISNYSLASRIDTTRPDVIIGASLDEGLAKSLADACYPIQKTHSLILFGMPNWDGFKSLYNKDEFKDFPIYFTTPHYENKGDDLDSILVKTYFQLYKTKPSDMAYKGFGITWYFTHILVTYPNDFMDHLNDPVYSVFHDYNFRPVFNEKTKTEPDYYENKHLFIMEILNGEIERKW
jgi:hypothetical protein